MRFLQVRKATGLGILDNLMLRSHHHETPLERVKMVMLCGTSSIIEVDSASQGLGTESLRGGKSSLATT